MRASRHNGRSGKYGVYDAKHNDRKFDVSNSEHIDAEKNRRNIYWDCYQGYCLGNSESRRKLTFSEVEKIYYLKKYGDHVEEQNKRNEKGTSFSQVEKINMISAINNQGTCHFLCYDENMTQQLFIDFMERLVKETDRKVLFIVDNLRVHHGKIVAEWLWNHKEEIELFFTSPYSPEINPDEYLNHNLKQNIHSGIIPHTKE